MLSICKETRIAPVATKIARTVGLIATVAAVYLHLLFATSAGALWRDEVNSLEVATMHSLREMWAFLPFDSFPALFFVILRTFAGVPSSVSDSALRGFGFGVGMLILGVVWLNAKWLRVGVPLLALALIGFNPMLIRYGDSIRAYGLGILLVLLTLGTMWRFVESFTVPRGLLAAAAAVLSVQALYYNAVLLFAVCLGGCLVTLSRRQLAHTFAILSVGGIAAVSLLPYAATIRRVQTCSFMWKGHSSFAELWSRSSPTLGGFVWHGLWLWSLLFVATILLGIWVLLRRSAEVEKIKRERLMFAMATLIIGSVSYAIFLRVLGYVTQPWYYIVFVAFAATCMEMILSCVARAERVLLARVVCSVLLMSAAISPTVRILQARQTNVDVLAASVSSKVDPDDLIVINTWNYGITFRRYYHGAAPFETVPPIEDLRCHRVDLVKRQMMSSDPIAPVLERMEATLRAGKTVWLLGGVEFVQPGQAPLQVRPGFDGPEGWRGGDFYKAWSQQVSALTQRHAVTFRQFSVPLQQRVIPYEDLPLSAFRGWRTDAPVTEPDGASVAMLREGLL